jgi:hypothetical protein
VLDDDQGVVSLFKNGHKLKDGEGSADLQIHKLAVQAAEDCGIVPADVEDLEPLQVRVAIQRRGEHLTWGYQGVEGPGMEGNGREEIEVHAVGWMVRGLKYEAREEGECEELI